MNPGEHRENREFISSFKSNDGSSKNSFKKSFKASIRKGKGNLHTQIEQKRSQRQQPGNITEANESKEILKTANQQLTIEDVIKNDNQTGGFEDGRTTNALFSDYILIEVACSCLGLFGVLLTVLEFDLEFNERQLDQAKTICYVITITSIILIVLTFLRFQAKLDWEKARKNIGQKETFLSTGLIWNVLGEMLLVLVGPLPWTIHNRLYFDCEPAQVKEIFYHVNEILSLILMLRVLLISRTVLMLSQWYSNRSQRVCRLYACESNYLFVVKCIMKQNPYTLVTLSFVSSSFYFGFLIRVCESPLYRVLGVGDNNAQNFYSYYNALWNIIITMTTVGYGDYYPQTHLGRFIIFVVSIWGVFIVSIMVVTMTNTLQTTSLENKAISVLDRLFVREKMKNSASTVLTTVGKISIENRKIREKIVEPNEKKMNQLIVKLTKTVNQYKTYNRQYRAICDDNISEEISRQFDFMRLDFKELEQQQKTILEANIAIMEHLKLQPVKVNKFKNFLNHPHGSGSEVGEDDKVDTQNDSGILEQQGNEVEDVFKEEGEVFHRGQNSRKQLEKLIPKQQQEQYQQFIEQQRNTPKHNLVEEPSNLIKFKNE